MPVIVTGGTGFIGSHLIEALLARGEQVRSISRSPLPAGLRVRRYVADYSRADIGVENAAFAGVSTVFHLAGATRGTTEADFQRANVGVTASVLNRVIGQSPRARFVLVSSQAAAGPSEGEPSTESDAPHPIEAYGRSKLAAERLVLETPGIATTVIRPAAVLGPRDRDFLALFSMLGRRVAVFPGNRHRRITTIFVDDLVRGILAAAASPTAVGQVYFLGGASAAWSEIYEGVAVTMGVSSYARITVPSALVAVGGFLGDAVGKLTGRPGLLSANKAALAPHSWECSSQRAARDFGFRATTPLDAGLRITYEWYQRHGWL